MSTVLTPVMKGQLTKAVRAAQEETRDKKSARSYAHTLVRRIFEKLMPREQAKHATRKYLATAGMRAN